MDNIYTFIEDTEESITIIDLVEFLMRDYYYRSSEGIYEYRDRYHNAIDEINYWFQYNNLGYEFQNGQLIRKDNQVIHSEAVKPALHFLSDPRFAGANQEMLAAYEARRNGNNADAIVNANKAFESAMKSICTEKGYTFDPQRNTAMDLITILKDNGYFPAHMNTHINGIRITLESGLPTTRNRAGGHGQGPAVTPIPDAFVDYALNIAATNIAFLARLL